jgi:transposase
MVFIGIDPSKSDLALSTQRGRARVKNDLQSTALWAAGLCPDTIVGVEATGRYHRPVLAALSEAGITTYLLNPMGVHRYVKAMSPTVKTDATDAMLIGRYVEREYDLLKPYKMPSKEMQELKDLLSFRETLLEKKVALRQSLSEQTFELQAKKKLDDAFKEMVAEVDRKIGTLAKASPLYPRMRKIDGVGPLGAAALCWLFGAFEFEDSDQAVAFTGLDVSVRESGRYVGQRKLTKRGPAFVRSFLFNGANSLRKLSELAPLFEHHAAKRLSTTAVNIIVARKLMRIAYAVSQNPDAVFKRENLLPQLRQNRRTDLT